MKKIICTAMTIFCLFQLSQLNAQAMQLPQGIYVGYTKSMINSFDIPLKNGLQVEYLFDQPGFLEFSLPFTFARSYPITDQLGQESDADMLTLDALIHFQLTKPHNKFRPKLYTGPGFIYETSGLSVLTGLVGAEIGYQFHPRTALVAGVQYRFGVEQWGRQAVARAGVVVRLGGSVPTNEAPVFADRDLDGIADEQDLCPDIPGALALSGCPDTDQDGIADSMDQCPELPGSPNHQGCPDTDQDGVPDETDACPDLPGTTMNNGCPNRADIQTEISRLQSGIQFQANSAYFLSVSFVYLEQIRSILERYPTYKMYINGHTDSTGSSEENEELSEQRARACYDYLVAHGIAPSRLSYFGFGELKPVADNRTEYGRQQNRRVEFLVFE
jgi:outer membrane protein OmpA-like peptidoglycan-associated protein